MKGPVQMDCPFRLFFTATGSDSDTRAARRLTRANEKLKKNKKEERKKEGEGKRNRVLGLRDWLQLDCMRTLWLAASGHYG